MLSVGDGSVVVLSCCDDGLDALLSCCGDSFEEHMWFGPELGALVDLVEIDEDEVLTLLKTVKADIQKKKKTCTHRPLPPKKLRILWA